MVRARANARSVRAPSAAPAVGVLELFDVECLGAKDIGNEAEDLIGLVPEGPDRVGDVVALGDGKKADRVLVVHDGHGMPVTLGRCETRRSFGKWPRCGG